MKAIGVQLDIVWEDKKANFEKVGRLLERASIGAGDLVVLPEMFATGFSMNVAGICESEAAETETFLVETARRHEAYIIAGLVKRQANGLGRNEALVVDPAGREIARYVKMHPFSFAGETKHYAPGDGPVVFRWRDFTVAPFICYDLRFPEAFRHATQRGAEVLVVIACWPDRREAHWTALLRARAIENLAYVVGVNRCGADPKLTYSGRSRIIDPRGNVLADAGSEEGTIAAQLDRPSLEAYRREFPALDDIRPEYRRHD